MAIDPTAPLTPEGPGTPVSGEPPPPGRSRRSIVWIVLATLVVGGAIGTGVVLLVSGGNEDSRGGVATGTSVATATSTVPTTTAPAPRTTAPAPRTTAPPQTAAPSAIATTAPAAPAPPVITEFIAGPTDITCTAADLAGGTPAEQVTVIIEYATRNATDVRITDPMGTTSDPLPASGGGPDKFDCGPPLTRSYTLTATGPGGTTSQVVTVNVNPVVVMP